MIIINLIQVKCLVLIHFFLVLGTLIQYDILMKVIFLDIDGVLAPHQKSKIVDGYFPYNVKFSTIAVKNLKSLLEQSQAKIVLSTKWVDRLGFETVVTTLASHGILGPYVVFQDVETNIADFVQAGDWLGSRNKFYGITITPKKMSSEKCHEISFWLSDYADKIEGYVVIDDDFIHGQEQYQVQTNGQKGLTKADVIKSLEILNSGMKNYYQKKADQKKRLG